MKGEKLDRRVRYTRMVLRQSLLELMKTTDINKITVKDVCELADVNRGTFYAHFSDPFELLRQIETEFLEEISAAIERHGVDNASNYPVISDIIGCIYENSDLCRIIFGSHGDVSFINEVLYMAQKRCIDGWGARFTLKSRSQLEYVYSFMAMGSVGILRKWIQDGMNETPEHVSELIDTLTYQGLRGLSESK